MECMSRDTSNSSTQLQNLASFFHTCTPRQLISDVSARPFATVLALDHDAGHLRLRVDADKVVALRHSFLQVLRIPVAGRTLVTFHTHDLDLTFKSCATARRILLSALRSKFVWK